MRTGINKEICFKVHKSRNFEIKIDFIIKKKSQKSTR